MHIRFHRGLTVDAVILTANDYTPGAAPGDVVWSIPQDINPSKTISITENVQATDPLSGQPLTNPDGSPVWKTTTVTNPDGTTSTQIVTQQVPQTVTLQQNPSQFTASDIASAVTTAGTTYTVVGSISEARAGKIASLQGTYVETLEAGITSSADGTSRLYGFAPSDQENLDEQTALMNAGKATWPITWADKAGNPVTLTQAQYTQLVSDVATFKWNQVAHLRQQVAAVESATSTSAVNAVSW